MGRIELDPTMVSDRPPPRFPRGVRRSVYLLLGLLFVGLATLGAFLPVLPTTPFLLLASTCFLRSSPVLNERLLRSRLFGPFLRDWQRYRGIRLSVKITAVVTLTAVVAGSVLFGNLPLPLLVLLVGLALVGLAVVLRLPVVRD
ncbi:MAG: YbaN family protein [Gemmataceae bacterium]|nr:YbaN family protein [Gemmataceae bacterium]